MFDKKEIILKRLNNIKNPVILELGVNRGRSTKIFFDYINDKGGKLFSIDIRDCSNALVSPEWNFFQCNDLNINEILKKFSVLKKGIDLLFIDSYHEPNHVKILLHTWFYYVKKDGFIYFDDTESYLYRLKKNITLSITNDSINDEIKKFYHQNYNQLLYTKYFHGTGLAEFNKVSDLYVKPNNDKIWKYNFFISKIYLFLKKLKFYFLYKFFKK
jgi:predicted O-methyltransferase YrrM